MAVRMKLGLRYALVFVVVMLRCVLAAAQGQSLPAMPDDKEIVRGTLPDGLPYFMYKNKIQTGLVDISLVQKADPSKSLEELSSMACERFNSSCFANTQIRAFLTRNGIYPDSEGFIRSGKGSVEYSFRNLSTACGERVVDSTLFAVFNIVSASGKEGLGTSSQVLLMSGDFDLQDMQKRLQILSVCCPAAKGDVPVAEYVWKPSSSEEGAIRTLDGPLSGVEVVWRMQRTPSKYMKTILPVMSGKISHELEYVLRHRLNAALGSAGIAGEFVFDHKGSYDVSGDELICVSVLCEPGDVDSVKKILEAELVRLRTWGVDQQEYRYVRDAYKWAWKRDAAYRLNSNAHMVHKLKAAFLYGASLATEQYKVDLAYRPLADSTQTRIFNRFITPLLDQSVVADPSVDHPAHLESQMAIAQTLASYKSSAPLKLPKDKTESITGGQFWTFSTGVNVVYKQVSSKGFTYYTYAAKGGRVDSAVELKTIDGVSREAFGNFLESEGIIMDIEYNPTDVRLKGCVPTSNLEMLLQCLAALSSGKANQALFPDKAYKLLVICGDASYDEVKRMLGQYLEKFGGGGAWTGARMQRDAVAQKEYHHSSAFAQYETSFKLDITSANYALQNLAVQVLENALACRMADYSVYPMVSGAFVGFPSDKYTLRMGLANAAPGGFGCGVSSAEGLDCNAVFAEVLEGLSAKPLPAASLKVFKARTRDAFNSYRTTAAYYVDIACDRYLDNRNLTYNYDAMVNTISAERLQKFFKDASAANSDR